MITLWMMVRLELVDVDNREGESLRREEEEECVSEDAEKFRRGVLMEFQSEVMNKTRVEIMMNLSATAKSN